MSMYVNYFMRILFQFDKTFTRSTKAHKFGRKQKDYEDDDDDDYTGGYDYSSGGASGYYGGR